MPSSCPDIHFTFLFKYQNCLIVLKFLVIQGEKKKNLEEATGKVFLPQTHQVADPEVLSPQS